MRQRIPDTDEKLLAECDVQVFRSSGPGGQGVNTTDSAVRLKHRPTGIVVASQRERSQLRNKKDCLARLRVKLEKLNEVAKPRHATKPTFGSKQRRLTSKRVVAQKKRLRGRGGDED